MKKEECIKQLKKTIKILERVKEDKEIVCLIVQHRNKKLPKVDIHIV